MIQRGVDTAGRLAAAALALAPAALAAESDKSSFCLFNPTPRELMRDMDTDRPDTTESPHTVDAGHVQAELSFADVTTDSESGTPNRSWQVAPLLLRVG